MDASPPLLPLMPIHAGRRAVAAPLTRWHRRHSLLPAALLALLGALIVATPPAFAALPLGGGSGAARQQRRG
eukprot:CAMPEP_0204563368 /NCGR_PEP_ID=MMETSP0661-20131031/34274_1 /ASSEMBLY_ACC=CAM_ASM_000606 /TAXON_ID=109239 /ORGANISM="Alexandrium margalefi, Strain AMGDE01CS-322" /LENGTH=71 /DNA_ID=CAMNT_0051570917 /DNA_START=25 /DNA_END=236 /DNA_ORIENTATION=-